MSFEWPRGSIVDRIVEGTFDQIGFVVPNLMEAMADFSTNLGIGPWSVWDYVPPFLRWREYRGGSGTFSIRAALAGTHPQIELIEPLEGPSIWHEFLASRGPGIHHLAFFVRSFRESSDALERLGIGLLMAGGGHGLDGDGTFGYFDTETRYGFVLEAIEHPRRRPPPARVYPSEGWTADRASTVRGGAFVTEEPAK